MAYVDELSPVPRAQTVVIANSPGRNGQAVFHIDQSARNGGNTSDQPQDQCDTYVSILLDDTGWCVEDADT